MKRIRLGRSSVPVAMALITIGAYGLLLPLTGFYWDDWPFAWIAHFQGSAEFIPAFRGFRPFLGPIFYVTTSLLPANPLYWQILALLVRFASGWAAWFLFGRIWPSRRDIALAAALLFLVFPGYSQHWVALTHINQEWISLIAYLLSLGISIQALRSPKSALVLTIGGLSLELVGLLPTEYFVGLELLRPLLFWVVLSETLADRASRISATLRAWWPFAVVWLLNAAWLTYYYRSGAYISYDLAGAAASPGVLESAAIFFDAVWKAGIFVWFQILTLVAVSPVSPSSLGTYVVMTLSFLVLSAYLSRLQLSEGQTPLPTPAVDDPRAAGGIRTRSPVLILIFIGIVGIVLGRLPSFVAALPLTLQSSFDRLTIAMMLGASLFVAGLIELLTPRGRARTLTLAALVALGIGQQFFNANIFRRDWQRQMEIYWQLAWRIPALEPQTAILAQQLPLDYETDLAMTAVVNWMYAPQPQPPVLPYAFVNTEKRLGGVVLPGLEPGMPMRLPLRTMEFKGTTSRVVAIYVPADGCLRVFDPRSGDVETYSRFPDSLTGLIPLSNPDLILTASHPAILPSPPFVGEPSHGWCYYYEKAEMGRQQADWDSVIAIRSTLSKNGMEAGDPFEWLPFIEAEARKGDSAWAADASRRVLNEDPRIARGLCSLWNRVKASTSSERSSLAIEILRQMNCSG